MKTILLNGENLQFENENDIMELSFRKTLGGSDEFIIELNCKTISMFKTFKPFENRVNWLIESRGLI